MATYNGRLTGDQIELTLRVAGASGALPMTAKRRNPNAPPPDWFSEPPASPEVVAWLRANAIRLATPEARHGFMELALKTRIGDARVVAVGEAARGVREFSQFNHRMLEFLVQEMGFTVLCIEANWTDSLAVNDYALTGKGDPAEVLRALRSWPWQTEEALEMIRWIRRYNEDSKHPRKIKFVGFDMRTAHAAVRNLLRYLEKTDPEYAEAFGRILEELSTPEREAQYGRAPGHVRRLIAGDVDELIQRFDRNKAQYVARSSESEWALARQNAHVVSRAANLDNANLRGMAENAKWILDQAPPGTKMMVAAYNGPIGTHLRDIFGAGALMCGLTFNQGAFRASDMKTNRMADFTVGPGPQGSLDATLASTGLPQFAIDLRTAPAGSVAEWLQAEHRSRQIGLSYSESNAGAYLQRMKAAKAYDLLIFVEKTSASRPL